MCNVSRVNVLLLCWLWCFRVCVCVCKLCRDVNPTLQGGWKRRRLVLVQLYSTTTEHNCPPENRVRFVQSFAFGIRLSSRWSCVRLFSSSILRNILEFFVVFTRVRINYLTNYSIIEYQRVERSKRALLEFKRFPRIVWTVTIMPADDELNNVLNRRQLINEGKPISPHFARVHKNIYVEFKEFTRKQIKDYEKTFDK